MAQVTVRFFGGAAAASGTTEAAYEAATVGQLLDVLRERHGLPVERILAVASVLLDGIAARDSNIALSDGQTVDVLPPFAGG